MDRKIKLFAASSLVAVLASGCAPYNAKTGTYGSNSGASQNSQVAATNTTCAPCEAKQYTYTKPAVTTGTHSQQWYIDRWNRQQQQQGVKPKPVVKPKTYSGYGGAKPSTNNYYDYSGAGYSTPNKNIYTGSTATATSNTASNKSIYTGSYADNTYKPYEPKTYVSGASGTIYAGTDTNTSGGYSDANGGGAVAAGSYVAGNSTYSVVKGDTVFSVMRLTGVYWKTIIKLNNLQAPSYTIAPGQTLRLK